MPRPEKGTMIDVLKGELARSRGAVVTELRGLSVSDAIELRRSVRQAGGRYRVVKNSLASRAMAGGPYEPLIEMMSGITGVATSEEDPVEVVRMLAEFARSHEALQVGGGVLDSATYSPENIQELAMLPPRPILLGMLACCVASPLTKLVGVLQGPIRSLATVLANIADKKEDKG